MMQHFIVIGNPINHSKVHKSIPPLRAVLGCESYQKQYCPNDADSFTAVVSAFCWGAVWGANITLPFKEMAFEMIKSNGRPKYACPCCRCGKYHFTRPTRSAMVITLTVVGWLQICTHRQSELDNKNCSYRCRWCGTGASFYRFARSGCTHQYF